MRHYLIGMESMLGACKHLYSEPLAKLACHISEEVWLMCAEIVSKTITSICGLPHLPVYLLALFLSERDA